MPRQNFKDILERDNKGQSLGDNIYNVPYKNKCRPRLEKTPTLSRRMICVSLLLRSMRDERFFSAVQGRCLSLFRPRHTTESLNLSPHLSTKRERKLPKFMDGYFDG